MSDTLGTYTFLPWLRDGIANEISGTSSSRATIPVELVIEGKKLSGGTETAGFTRDVEIYGPGDITGLDSRSIVKVEPRNWVTNFETNYLPYIDFYDEDLPWRYSPAVPANHRLKPWLALVVLKEDEFSDGKHIKDKPLPHILLTDQARLQDPDQLWAWAHVHVDKDLITDDFKKEESNDAIARALGNLLKVNPDLAHSRIMCPRRLEEKQAYHAFLVPAFESGRLAGLAQDPNDASSATAPSWTTGTTDGLQMPYYHRWHFRTGAVGDFEYLVRLLEPKPADKRVGRRAMDMQKPGANLRGMDPSGELGAILNLGGALKVPDMFYSDAEFEEVQQQEYWAFRNDLSEEQITDLSTDGQPSSINDRHPFQNDVAAFVNLQDSYQESAALDANQASGITEESEPENPEITHSIADNPDPLITAPLYGRWHAMANRLVQKRDGSDISPNYNWVHELNMDARWRVSAGFGTKVVQENQENYMKSAWDQVGDILEANNKIREAQLSKLVAGIYHLDHLGAGLSQHAGKWLGMVAPVHGRVLADGLTVHHQKKNSKLSLAATSVNMRKLLRPKGKVLKRLTFDDEARPDNLIERINDGAVTAAPPKTKPEGIPTTEDFVEAAKPKIPPFISRWVKSMPWLKWIFLLVILLIVLLIRLLSPGGVIMSILGVMVLLMLWLFRSWSKWSGQIKGTEALSEENQTEAAVDDLRKSPDFRISDPLENFKPSFGSSESNESIQFKLALKSLNATLQLSAELGVVQERPSLDLATINVQVFQSLAPTLTIPRWVLGPMVLPPFAHVQLKEKFVEAMAYPKFDLPMYKPLTEYSSELFLPNINYLEQNSISLLETNQKFIESYMVGLNHEFARELLWREYPTDQRGSYFRQFWDVNGFLDRGSLAKTALIDRLEKLLDSHKDVDLQDHLDRLSDPEESITEDYLSEVHLAILREELKDIKPLHTWSKYSKLGQHDNREAEGESEEEVVLAIRGELLKKYPTAVIYAHKAVWQDEDNNPVLSDSQTIDPKKERTLMPIPEDQQDNPPPDIIKAPLYEAKVDPDIYFFGFDLTACVAKGGTGKEDEEVDDRCAEAGITWDDAGWFFVIKERPGEPRFGLDLGEGGNIESNKIELWNDLSWGDVKPAVPTGAYLQVTNEMNVTADQALEIDDSEKINQQEDDKHIGWNADVNSAELAYILYQVPVLVAVHAAEMLPDVPNN